jgi:hypothetical protein
MLYCPPNIRSELSRLRISIVQEIARVTWSSHHDAFTKNGSRPNEVFTLYHFFLTALPEIEAALQRGLGAGFAVTVSGVINHGTAYVKSTQPVLQTGACELGDILFISTYGGVVDGVGLGNALLVQAKVGRDGITDKEQCYLYKEATAFKYRDSAFSQASRQLPPKTDPALAYWSFEAKTGNDLSLPHWYWGGASGGGRVIQPLQLGNPANDLAFADALCTLLMGAIGRGFELPQRGKDGWNEIIDDLVQGISNSAINNKMVRREGLSGTRGQLTPALINTLISQKRSVSKTSISEIFGSLGNVAWQNLGKALEAPDSYVTDEELDDIFERSGEPRSKPRKEASPGRGAGNLVPPSEIAWGDGDDGQGGAFVVVDIREATQADRPDRSFR